MHMFFMRQSRQSLCSEGLSRLSGPGSNLSVRAWGFGGMRKKFRWPYPLFSLLGPVQEPSRLSCATTGKHI